MIEEGETAPAFDLPGVIDGEIEQLSTAEFFAEEIVILAFYPGDFNPACDGAETGLDELDLFTMQKDVTVLAISGDSVHSHRAFAEEYGLHMPLLSDTDGRVAAEYGVAVEDDTAGYLTNRAVIVVDHERTVQFAWQSENVREMPATEAVREAIGDIGDEETAQSRYRVGHARYMEGRRAFTSAMKAFEQDEWMMAQTDFTRAADEFDEAGEEFNTATRFAEESETRTYFERAEKKAEALWRAADWLSQSANAFSSGQGAKAESLRSDAEAPLETARDLHDPPAPDDFPPEEDPAEQDTAAASHEPFVPDKDEGPAASLDADLDVDDEPVADEGSATDPRSTADGGQGMTGEQQTRADPLGIASGAAESGSEETDDHASIDDDELEEITASLEEQSEATEPLGEPEAGGGNVVPDTINPGTVPDDGTDATDEDELAEEPKSPPAESESTDAVTATPDESTTGDGETEQHTGTTDEVDDVDDTEHERIEDKFVGGVDVVEKYIGDVDISTDDSEERTDGENADDSEERTDEENADDSEEHTNDLSSTDTTAGSGSREIPDSL